MSWNYAHSSFSSATHMILIDFLLCGLLGSSTWLRRLLTLREKRMIQIISIWVSCGWWVFNIARVKQPTSKSKFLFMPDVWLKLISLISSDSYALTFNSWLKLSPVIFYFRQNCLDVALIHAQNHGVALSHIKVNKTSTLMWKFATTCFWLSHSM